MTAPGGPGGLRATRAVPVAVRRAASRARHRLQPRPHSGCYAPSVQLYLYPDGDVRPCCVNTAFPLGNVGEQRLLDIWHGARRRTLVEHLAEDDFSLGCTTCAWEIEVEGRPNSLAGHFDLKAGHLTGRASTAAWPRWMEFNLSNSCNLQCIQCHGDLSSSIRIHREGRPPLPKVYGDEFFEDLVHFLPHLVDAQFAGGEPFMAPENYRVWDLIAEVAPQVRCRVVTNATQWNRRVERVLEQLPLGFCFSIDGVTRETYESIREGADFEQVMVNLDRFCDYARAVGTDLNWNFCLMPQNVHEFGAVLREAEERGIVVSVQVVHTPASASLAALPPADLAEVHRALLAESPHVLPTLRLNARVWQTELERIGAWVAAADPERHLAVWEGPDRSPAPAAPPPVAPPPPATILGLPRRGRGPWDASAAVAAVEGFAADDRTHRLLVDDAGTVVECGPDAAAALGVEVADLLGRPVDAIQVAAEASFGPLSAHEVVAETDDQVEATSRYGDREFRVAIVALRDDDGEADRAAIVFASRPVD